MPTLILILVIIAAAVVFSVQNAAPAAVSFLAWKFEASLAVIVLLSVASGLVTGVLMVSLWRLRRSMRERKAVRTGPAKDGPGSDPNRIVEGRKA